MKDKLAKATLQPIDEAIPFTVETDASDFAISATLNQNGRPVAFHARTLSNEEQKHSAVEKEAYVKFLCKVNFYYPTFTSEWMNLKLNTIR